MVIFCDFSDFFGNWKFLVIFLVIFLKVSNILVIAWNSTKYVIMTQPVIQKFNENSYSSMPAKLYIQIASCWPKLSSWIDGILRNPADHHSPCADCVLGTRGPGRSSWHHICILHNCNQKVQVRKKSKKKLSFSDGKCFTHFVLLRCFIDFQTTLVDGGNLVIFSTFW